MMNAFFLGVFGFAAVVFALGYLCYGVALLAGMWFSRKDRAETRRALMATQAGLAQVADAIRDTAPKKEPWE